MSTDKLWPTPRASNPGSRTPGIKSGKVLAEEVKKLWHMPMASDKKETHEKRYPGGGTRKHPIPNLAAEVQDGIPYAQQVENRQEPTSQLTLLPEDSLASLSVLPGSEEARKMTVTSGQKLSGFYENSAPLGSLLRMLAESTAFSSQLVMLTWKPVRYRRWQTVTYGISLRTRRLLQFKSLGKRFNYESWRRSLTTLKKRDTKSHELGRANPSYYAFQLVPSTPRIDAIESSLWHTPSGQEPGVTVERLVTKDGQPAKVGERAYDKETGRLAQVGLTQQVKMFPTPSGDDTNQGEKGRASGTFNSLTAEIKQSRTANPISGELNPMWVEKMMGFPVGHTDIGTETGKPESPESPPESRTESTDLEPSETP